MMQEDLIALMLADTAIAALVGDRITWNEIPQGSASPSLVLYLISAPVDYLMTGPDGLAQVRVQIDARALNYRDALALGRAVKALLSGLRVTHGGTRFDGIFVAGERHDSAKPNAGELWHRVSIDFFVWAAAA